MTGFSRAAGDARGASITWEVKSVNGKSLELRLRLPTGYDRLEPAIRQAIQKRFSRGSFQAQLTIVRPTASQVQPIVNEAFLRDVAELAKRLEKQFGTAPATADGLLSLRGVLDIPEATETEEDKAVADKAALAVLETALDGLEAARRAEGGALATVLNGHLETIAKLTENAERDPSRDPALIRERLGEQIRALMEAAGSGLDEQRLHTEAMLLSTKSDIREEIDRLKTHVAAARSLLSAGGVVGRKLDFLAQEFNREANTLCSKSNAASLTAIGLDLKAVVDQFREQVQNLE
ncbi:MULTISPECIES: YicC/YloC family endoribonuclease [Mesorhizobium]|uniref:YicC family protein n=1 Tax=Mesorhizobium denitrificans TaxID=2294114 RepID=A0A371XIQ5_9HYPH|nr:MULTISPECIES: YicC/YloC family endoribonuclease [Mesorhizobium]RFC69097.1 YicC family protein [Mesorhizobium denitrificans]